MYIYIIIVIIMMMIIIMFNIIIIIIIIWTIYGPCFISIPSSSLRLRTFFQVTHTPSGATMIKNFVLKVVGCRDAQRRIFGEVGDDLIWVSKSWL